MFRVGGVPQETGVVDTSAAPLFTYGSGLLYFDSSDLATATQTNIGSHGKIFNMESTTWKSISQKRCLMSGAQVLYRAESPRTQVAYY